MAQQMKTPLLYPCANRVKIPHVGADESVVTRNKSLTVEQVLLSSGSSKTPADVNNEYIKKISGDITFSEDVVKDRCFHLLPYSDKYFYDALDPTDIVPQPPRSSKLVGRHNSRVADKKHLPCHIKKRGEHQLKPMKRKILERALEMHQRALEKEKEKLEKEAEERKLEQQKEPKVFLTATLEEGDEAAIKAQLQQKKDNGWDEYLMTKISETTARWIIAHHISAGEEQDKLESLVDTYHGPTEAKPELIEDNISEDGDKKAEDKRVVKPWKRGDESLLDRIRDMQLKIGKPTDPYADDTAAAFYRLPAGIRKARKSQEREQQGSINATAANIQVQPYELPPPPTLRDYMNPAIGPATMFTTDSMFQQEWLTGAAQVYQRNESKDKILLDSNNKYKKHLQKESPRPPLEWYPMTDEERKEKKLDATKIKKSECGHHRWRALPQPIDDTAEKMSLNTPGLENLLAKSPDLNSRKTARNNSTLVQIVDDWRNKWNLDMRYADASPDDLIRDMADIHPHIRLKAVTTCARAAEYRPPPDPGIQLTEQETRTNPLKFLPDKLFIALECLLEDDHEQVRRAAAITLYTLEKPVPKAENILRTTLRKAKSVDRWTACQCLAYYGECDSEVVGELVAQLLNSEDGIRRERAAFLLAKLSENSMLVHSMLGEQLNSSSWRHRVMACKIIPKLYGQINKDLVHKLTHIMWNDWHSEVRKAAAQTLGKTCHGKDVHDELREKILSGSERERVEAISKVGHLGIMTAKLLPALLKCFHDNYVSVRMEACVACNNLKITNDQVVEKLVFLATFDPIWKIKALALQALGNNHTVSQSVRECVLWAFRYEDQEGVRAEACHTLVVLGLRDQEVAQILQDRYLVEPSHVVRQEITTALEILGISPTEDMDMVAQIKNEVRKICTRNNVCAHITANEGDAAKQANIERMIDLEAERRKKKELEDEQRAAGSRSLTGTESAPLRPRYQLIQGGSEGPLRPPSRDGTVSSVDDEIKNILNRENTQESGSTSSGSRPGSRSRSQRKTPMAFSEGEEVAEVDTAMSQRSKSAVSLGKIDEEDSESGVEECSNKKREVVLGERSTYVEVNVGADDSVDGDVLRVQHMSPCTSDLELRPPPPGAAPEADSTERR